VHLLLDVVWFISFGRFLRLDKIDVICSNFVTLQQQQPICHEIE